MPFPPPTGVLLVDKPGGITSHDVVARVRRALHERRVGHAGTLDPMATGLLVIGIGPATKLLHYFVGLDKEYTATIRLGASTTTDDAEGQVMTVAVAATIAAIDESRIRAGIAALTGEISQRPSSVSAIKVDGRRAYDLVRSGESVELPAREVTISAFEVLGIRTTSTQDGAPVIDVDVRVECSSGTYIRALARDLGEGLGVGGHLTVLRRERIGPFSVRDAAPIESREKDAPFDEAVAARLLTPAEAAALRYPTVVLGSEAARDLADGKRIPMPVDDGGPYAAVTTDGRLIGIVEVAGARARVLMNLPVEAPATTEEAP